MDTLRPLPKKRYGKECVFGMINHCTKHTKPIPTITTSYSTVPLILLEHWVANYGIESTLLTINGP